MENVPYFIGIAFWLTSLMTIILFYLASRQSLNFLIVLLIWMALQSMIAGSGFYTNTDTLPPRFLLLVGPPVIFIIGLFLSKSGRQFMDNADIRLLTILHFVRISVEMILFILFFHSTIPELMTFEGRNLDILSGLTAPLVYLFGFKNKKPRRLLLIVWNLICLGLLMNIVINAAMSVPGPLQQQAFDQPNIAILHFPYNLLPSCVVPLVLLSHLISLRQLFKKEKEI